MKKKMKKKMKRIEWEGIMKFKKIMWKKGKIKKIIMKIMKNKH